MLVKVCSGTFDAPAGDIEPNGGELWSGGHESLSAASLAGAENPFEVGTWYKADEFEKLLEAMPTAEGQVPSTVSVNQLGVAKAWSAAIEVDEMSAALMLCRSVLHHARQLADPSSLWVRVE